LDLPDVAVFVVSALVHEYVFSMAIGRVQGYQTAFFMIQGIAVAATLRARPRGAAAVAAVAATFAFNVASGVLFFASVNRVLPFYENAVPLWDERWRPSSEDTATDDHRGYPTRAKWYGNETGAAASVGARAPDTRAVVRSAGSRGANTVARQAPRRGVPAASRS
jgi:hypothetical protein